MILRDNLNEFELDWAYAPLRSSLIRSAELKGEKVLLVGEDSDLSRAIAFSFLAWNEKEELGVQLRQVKFSDGGFLSAETFWEQSTAFAPEEADFVILPGLCCREVRMSASEEISYLQQFTGMMNLLAASRPKRVLLLSDGRVYGRLPYAFAASEYEAGETDTSAKGCEAQFLMQAMEETLTACARANSFAYEILRTGQIYGPCITGMNSFVTELARKTAAKEEISVFMQPDRASFICIHDLLSAIQFVLCNCPDDKIFNVSGLDSDVSEGETAVLLYQNFPDQCRLHMSAEADPGPNADEASSFQLSGALLNTQLIRHYGFVPSITIEDGLIMLVKSLQKTDEIFIFDNTYHGKLDTVQQILLGFLLEVDRICRKYGIKYFLGGGTLLGAIRHHGFIPWDDDADVMMLREDYERFLQAAKEELPENIFIQLPETEKGNYNPFTKLRINDTMFATEFTGHFMDMHNGIFLDVLAHDKTANHKWSQKLHLYITMLARSVVFNKWGDTDVAGGGKHPRICWIVSRVKKIIPMRFALWAQNKALRFFEHRDSRYLYDGMGRNLSRGAFPAEWLQEAVYVDFEGYQLPVPKEYDKYLTWLYGDYMQMIPVSQRRTSHDIVLTDLGEYSEFKLKQKKEGDR